MNSLIHSPIGLFHLLTAVAALVLGTVVIALQKGSKLHRLLGYAYFYSMLTMNGSAFFLYNLFGVFGPFHVAALLSLATLIAGMVPAIRRKPENGWLRLHGTFMFFSVVGLYAALFAEILTRIPGKPFFTTVGLVTIAVTLAGAIIFNLLRNSWFRGTNSN